MVRRLSSTLEYWIKEGWSPKQIPISYLFTGMKKILTNEVLERLPIYVLTGATQNSMRFRVIDINPHGHGVTLGYTRQLNGSPGTVTWQSSEAGINKSNHVVYKIRLIPKGNPSIEILLGEEHEWRTTPEF